MCLYIQYIVFSQNHLNAFTSYLCYSSELFRFFFITDSPKRQNKGNTSNNNKNIRNVGTTKRTILSKSKAKSMAHDIVVVREANKKVEIDPDIQRLQVNNMII